MSQIPNINTHNIQPPLYNQPNAQTVQTPQGQTVSVSPNTHQIYQYPQTSLYDTSKQATSGVNIYIYNPSGIGKEFIYKVGEIVEEPASCLLIKK